ncbi:MAG: hypothetical protein AAGG59_04285 [Bacteroidota bacterium]
MVRLLLLLVLAIWSSSCQKSGTTDPDLINYVHAVSGEAAKRGYDISRELDQLNIIFDDLDGLRMGSAKGDTVKIDAEAWKYLSERKRIVLLAHEIGHAVLKRGHTNTTLRNGECKSIMSDNTALCTANVQSDLWYEYYLDELFNENTGAPKWYSVPNLAEVSARTPVMETVVKNNFFMDTIKLDDSGDFEISLNYNGQGRMYNPLLRWNGLVLDYQSGRLKLTNVLKEYSYLSPYFYGVEVTESTHYHFRLIKIGDFVWLYLNDILLHQFEYEPRRVSGDHIFMTGSFYYDAECILKIGYLKLNAK